MEFATVSMVMHWDAVEEGELRRLEGLDADELADWYEDHEDRLSFDVDKAWHGVHAVLTGTPWDPEGLGRAVLGGREFGEDNGYGRPRALSPAEVREVADELEALPVEQFRSRIDFAELTRLGIYPEIWDREEEGDELVEYLTDGFETIRQGFRQAAEGRMAIVISCL